MKKLLYFSALLLWLAACDKDIELNDDISGAVQMKCTFVGEFDTQSNSATIKAEEGGEFIIQSEYPSRITSFFEYGDSFELPIGKEYSCVIVHRDGVRYDAYATYLSNRLNYGADYELIDPNVSYSYVLPWSFDHRGWYEISQLEEHKYKITIKPCNEYRFLAVGIPSYNAPIAAWGSISIECIPASEFEANR